MQNFLDLRVVTAAHSIKSSSVEVQVTVDGAQYRLCGKSARVMDMSIPSIELLTKDSTSQTAVLAESATADFTKASEALVKDGHQFYTVLRSGWNLPAFLWQVAQARK